MPGQEVEKPAILIVDDSPFFRRMLRELLEKRGYSCLATGAGAEIPRLLRDNLVAVVVSDLNMPGIDGLEVLRLVREQHPEVGFILCSSSSDFNVARRLLREGVLDYLLKPLDETEVVDAIERGFAHYHLTLNAAAMRREAERRLGELVLLREIGETASTGEDLQSLFDKIIESIAASADVEVASLMLLEDDCRLHLRAGRGLAPEILSSVTVGIGEGISGHVLATGQPVLIDDVERDGRFDSFVGGLRYKNRSALSVPIRYKDRILGVININNKRSGGTFNLEDQNLLSAIAHQVALAIENFKLFTSLRYQTQQLEVANRSLVKLNQARSRLVCNLSHELKTPLTSITGYADLTLNFFERLQPTEVKEYLGRVHEECGHMDRLISGMMRLFSIESGKETWRWRPIAVGACAAEALMAKNAAIEEMHLQLEVRLPENLLDAYGDPEKLGIVFNALVDNAVKFNRPKGLLAVSAGNRRVGDLDYVYVQVHNDGHCIPDESAEDVFEQYTQLGDINTAKPPGVGVGLAIVKAVLQRMKGQIFLEKRNGEGSTFGLLLPTEATFGVLGDD